MKAGMKMARKKGTAWHERMRKSFEPWFSSMPALIALTIPSEGVHSGSERRSPRSPSDAAKEMPMAPMVSRGRHLI